MAKTLLNEAMGDYAQFRASQGLAPSTLKSQRIALRSMLASVGNIHIDSITERHITVWVSDRAKVLRPATLALEHTHTNKFFDWCRKSSRCKRDHDPMAGRRAPRLVKKDQPRLPVAKFPHLLEVAGQSCGRDRAMMALGLFTCLRSNEIVSLRVRDLDLDSGYLFARITKSYTEDRIGVSSVLDAEMRTWLREYAQLCGALDPDWYLVPQRNTMLKRVEKTGQFRPGGGEVMLDPTRRVGNSVYAVARRHLVAVGMENVRGIGMHTLRRSGARALYDVLVEQGRADALRVVQTMLHHQSQVTTQHYIGVQEDRETRDALVRGKVLYGFERDNVTQLGVKAVGQDQGVASGM